MKNLDKSLTLLPLFPHKLVDNVQIAVEVEAGGLFINNLPTGFQQQKNVAFLHFLRHNLPFFVQVFQQSQPTLCQKVAEWLGMENSRTFAAL